MFRLLAEVHPEYCPSAILYKWVSQRTGMQVVLVRKQMPAVNGYFAVATEINDNSGCPHTLEHLVFMGSRKWPYKGLLDILGSKMMSDTNAWTAQDQTVYTLTSAGWEGFRTLLPVYLDHVLHPTITDEACLTEVFHVDGTGQERGVVFSEMQGVENLVPSLVAAETQKLLYAPDSGYATNTGGLMDALRSLRAQDIRKYHEDSYRPSNLCVLVTGDVEPSELLGALKTIDDEIPALPDTSNGSTEKPAAPKRPFIDSPRSQISRLAKSKQSLVSFPDKDEEFGEVHVTWVGPAVDDLVGSTAMEVLGYYLTESGAGKLQLRFLDVDDAPAADVTSVSDDYLRSIYDIFFDGVPTGRLQELADSFLEWIATDFRRDFDIEFARICVELARNRFVLWAERSTDMFEELAVTEFLYGSGDHSTFRKWTESVEEFDILKGWSREQWIEFITREFVQNARAVVLAAPSIKMYEDLRRQAADRLEWNRSNRDLNADRSALESAERENDRPIPSPILDAFPSPDPAKIRFIETQSAATKTAVVPKLKTDQKTQQLVDEDSSATPGSKLGLSVTYESFPSEFVAVRAFFSVNGVDSELLPLVQPILCHIFDMGMQLEDGTELNGEQVAFAVKRDLLEVSVSSSWVMRECVSVSIEVKRENFDTAALWLERMVSSVIWDPARVGNFLQRHLSSLAEDRRSGEAVVSAIHDEVILTPQSLNRQLNSLLTESQVRDALEDLPATATKMKRLTSQLFRPETTRILVMGDVTRLKNPVSTFSKLESIMTRNRTTTNSLLPLQTSPLSDLGRNPAAKATLALCPGTESAYVIGVASAPATYDHKDLIALQLTNSYLGVVEGPLWRAVRGAGLAYGASISTIVPTASLEYNLYRAADARGGIEAVRKVVQDLASGVVAVDPSLLTGAQRSIVNTIVRQLNTPIEAATFKYYDAVVKDRGPDYTRNLINDLHHLGPEDVVATLNKYYLPLFDAKQSVVFAAAHPSQQESIESFLTDMGYEVEIKEITGQLSDSGSGESGSGESDSGESDSTGSD